VVLFLGSISLKAAGEEIDLDDTAIEIFGLYQLKALPTPCLTFSFTAYLIPLGEVSSPSYCTVGCMGASIFFIPFIISLALPFTLGPVLYVEKMFCLESIQGAV